MFRSGNHAVVVVVIVLILYGIAVILNAVFWADLVAPVFGLLASVMVFHAIMKTGNKQFRLNFILIGAAVLSWGIADLLWFISAHLLRADPDDSNLIAAFYFLTNVFLTASTVLYAHYRLRKWNAVQLVLDGVTFSVAILWLLWALLYDKKMDTLNLLANNGIINSIAIGMDVFLIIIIGIWYLSIRKGNLPLFLRIMVGSVFLFSLTDLIYYHLYSKNLYIPDSYIDICYMVTLLGIAVSVKMYYIKYPSVYSNPNQNTNVGNQHKGLILIFCPVIILLFGRIDTYDVVLYSVLILVHESASSFIQKTIGEKTLLSQEKDINKKLEQLVSEKTNDLKIANDELRQRNEDLKYINLHDPLTGLHNRVYFLEKLEEAIQTSVSGDKVVLFLWNVDNLKGINDTYGHFTGDKILIQHAHRVKGILEGVGVLARLGGDEFAYIFEGDLDKPDAIRIAQQVVRTCDEPYQIGGYVFRITVAVGISMYPTSAGDQSTLLKNADIAMHYVKDTKLESHIATYIDIGSDMNRKYTIGNSLRIADYDRDLRLYYQPQFSMADRRLIGMEALLRWDCPGIGPVSPAEFIPIAEEENQIIPIGNWVIENAVSRIAAWNRAYHTRFRIGINISPKQFDQVSTFEVLDASIKRHKARAQWIDIEITEGVALDNVDSAGNIKKYFKNRGITVSIDDFGTGYSSLGYLTILSFDRLKIAKPLIDRITTDESSLKIVTSIILLAKSLDLQTIAEGVETKEQLDLLLKLGCDQIQGYYLGRPVPKEEFEETFLKHLAAGAANAPVEE